MMLMRIKKNAKFVGIDLFAGAGGMSLGASMAGIDVQLAIENDYHAAATYAHNHPETRLIVDNISNVKRVRVPKKGKTAILFGGAPCQGFSTSNQRTRTRKNSSNWLFMEFLRLVNHWRPDWIVYENVQGIIETEGGYFLDKIIYEFEKSGYTCSSDILCASNFGVPQNRYRFFLLGSFHGISLKMPRPTSQKAVTVRKAIADLPSLSNGASKDYLPYPCKAKSNYAKSMRNGQPGCRNHLVTKNAPHVVDRYNHIPQGGNWEDIPECLMHNYTDRFRCHTGIYKRLYGDRPSVVIGNYRKNMLIHPWENRGLSVREAARLQSFPDWYDFQGSIGFKQQQVANAVPPLLAMAVFSLLTQME